MADEALNISALLLAGLSSESEDSDPPPRKRNGVSGKVLKKRTRGPPVTFIPKNVDDSDRENSDLLSVTSSSE